MGGCLTLNKYLTLVRERLNESTTSHWYLANVIKLYNYVGLLEDYADIHGPKYHHSAGMMKLEDANLIINAPSDISLLLDIVEIYRVALQEALDKGNLATIGKWDATDDMKDLCYEALTKAEGLVEYKLLELADENYDEAIKNETWGSEE